MKMSAVMAAVTLAAAVVFSLANPAKAQQGHAIPIQVQPGQTFLLDMSYAVGGAAGVGSFDMTLALGLEIEEMGPQGGVWRWSVEDIGFDLKSMAGGAAALNPLAAGPAGPGFNQAVSAGLRLMTDLDLVCRVDARGACVEVLNWPQWRERAENAVLLVTCVLRFWMSSSSSKRRLSEGVRSSPPSQSLTMYPAVVSVEAMRRRRCRRVRPAPLARRLSARSPAA